MDAVSMVCFQRNVVFDPVKAAKRECSRIRVRSVPSRTARPPSPEPFPHAHPYPINSLRNDADPHGPSGMRTRLLLHGRCPHSLPRRDYRFVRGPHLPFLFRALSSRLGLRGIYPCRREVWGAPMVLSRGVHLQVGGRRQELQYRRAA